MGLFCLQYQPESGYVLLDPADGADPLPNVDGEGYRSSATIGDAQSGDGLMGVVIAFWAGAFGIPEGFSYEWMGPLADGAALAMLTLLAILIIRSARRPLTR